MARRFKIYTGSLFKIGGLVKTRKQKDYPYSKREKNIALATLEGAGAGFVAGTFTGGLIGMLVGVPTGVVAGNVYARKRYPSKGRKPNIQFPFLTKLFNPRGELIARREKINRMELARIKSIRGRQLYAKRRR